MDKPADFDIAIIGSGIAGSALCLALKGSNYKVALIDPQPLPDDPPILDTDINDYDPRVFALNLASIDLLKRLSAWDKIQDLRHQVFNNMYVVDGEGTGTLRFTANEINQGYLGSIVEHRVLLYALQSQLRQDTSVTVLNNVRVDSVVPEDDQSHHHLMTLSDGQCLSTRLVVGADGGNSQVRDGCYFKVRQWDYGHTAIVCTLALEKAHQQTAWQRFMHSGPLAFLPLPSEAGQSFVSIVWSVNTDLADQLMGMSDERFITAVFSNSENWFGSITGISRRFSFPLRQCHAVDYVKPGIALIADAAHVIHPLAGQGINLGLQDVSVLADELLRSHDRGIDPGNIQVLSRYQRRRKGENLAMMAAMDTFKYLFSQPSLGFSLFRQLGMQGVMQSALIRQRIIRHAAGLR